LPLFSKIMKTESNYKNYWKCQPGRLVCGHCGHLKERCEAQALKLKLLIVESVLQEQISTINLNHCKWIRSLKLSLYIEIKMRPLPDKKLSTGLLNCDSTVLVYRLNNNYTQTPWLGKSGTGELFLQNLLSIAFVIQFFKTISIQNTFLGRNYLDFFFRKHCKKISWNSCLSILRTFEGKYLF
jgi:hypothetical protein